MESAGVTLLKGNLMGIVRARHLSEATMRNIRRTSTIGRHPAGGGCSLSILRLAALSDHRTRRHGAVVGERYRQRAQAASVKALTDRSGEPLH
jgi:hypothetical protein